MKRSWILLFGLLLASCGSNNNVTSPDDTAGAWARGGGTDPAGGDAPTISEGTHGSPDTIAPILPYPTGVESIRRQKLPILKPPSLQVPGHRPRLSPLALGGKSNVVALKILVITAGTNDSEFETAKAVLSQQAIPYDVLDATTTDLTEATLMAADGSGKYQGVVLTTGGLGYESSPNVWESALTWAEWSLLWDYEKIYQVRQLTLYTYPGSYPEDYGIRALPGAEGDWNKAKVTTDGKQVFSDLNLGTDIPIGDDPALVPYNQRKTAWNYPSTLEPVAGVTAIPLLTGKDANTVLAVQSNTSDGRERVALTIAQNPYLLHSQLFSYGLLNWLTKGLYLGEFRRYIQVDVDDWFLADDLWKPTSNSTGSVSGEYRISASDALAVRSQQTALGQKYPVANTFKIAVAFNAGGANLKAPNTCSPSATSVDPLTSVSRCMNSTFDWFSHSRDHLSMDQFSAKTYNLANQQWQGNVNRGSTLGLKFSPTVAVSGEHSGFGWYNKAGLDYDKTDYGLRASNQKFLDAAFDAGIRFLRSNRGVTSQYDTSCPNSCGIQHPMKNLFLVPAWPTNIFYYASTPDEVVSSYNAMYGPQGLTPFFNHNFTYAEILAKETEIAMNHVLTGSMFPHYLHQTNLRQYETGKSLVFDWTDSVLNSYSRYSNLPLKTLAWKDLGPYVKQRTAFVKGVTPSTPDKRVTGTWDRTANSITLNSPTAITAYVTGTRAGTSVETYGQTVISQVALAANIPVTFTIQK